jgi:hypothetical protein
MNNSREQCPVCEETISSLSAPRTSHYRRHVRDGSMREFRKDGKLYWEPTGEEPKPKQQREKPYSVSPSRRATMNISRRLVYARIHKKQLQLKCKSCNKWNHVRYNFADDRFLAANCCDSVIIMSKRDIPLVEQSKGEVQI